MDIMIIKIGAITVTLLAVSTLISRRMFACLTRRDLKANGTTSQYYQMVDPYIASIIAELEQHKALRGRGMK